RPSFAEAGTGSAATVGAGCRQAMLGSTCATLGMASLAPALNGRSTGRTGRDARPKTGATLNRSGSARGAGRTFTGGTAGCGASGIAGAGSTAVSTAGSLDMSAAIRSAMLSWGAGPTAGSATGSGAFSTKDGWVSTATGAGSASTAKIGRAHV